jgi:hypothetical protein
MRPTNSSRTKTPSIKARAPINAPDFFHPGLQARDIFLQMKVRKRTSFSKDKRRKHHHWQVTVFYKDGERFSRTYTVQAKAAGFARRQKKSPVVKMARVIQVS